MKTGLQQREAWLSHLQRMAQPVLENLAAGRLRETMPVESMPGEAADRAAFTHLEALGRTLCGIAPWLEATDLEADEQQAQARFLDWSRQAVAQAVDPDSPDRLNFENRTQPLVDAAFLCQALLRSPRGLWERLDPQTQRRLIDCLRATRWIRPPFNNWLLFAATIEAFFCSIDEPYDPMRIDYAIRQHEAWYLGGGIYSDGPQLHFDYYNSFVIQPMLIDVLAAVRERRSDWREFEEPITRRAQTAACLLEQLIAPDGSFAALGRSITYRFGVFHLLGQMALLHRLPESLPPARVRCAMSAVLERTMDAPGTYDAAGFLRIGLAGRQMALAETYISTGSLYLTTFGLLPLGLGPQDRFWTDPPEPWTSQRLWSGEDIKRPTT